MTTQDNGVRYLIHKTGTRTLDLKGTGMKYTLPAPQYWRDTKPMCGEWTDASRATVYKTTRAYLPEGGEWIETYAEVAS